jgi:hypothetical protein
MLARAAAVACLLIIGGLALSLIGRELNPFALLVNGLALVGVGYNTYFLCRWLRALVRFGRKPATLSMGAAWLLVCVALSAATFVLGFASCAGGCGAGGPGAAGLLFMLGSLGAGVGFNRWLDRVHPASATPAPPAP